YWSRKRLGGRDGQLCAAHPVGTGDRHNRRRAHRAREPDLHSPHARLRTFEWVSFRAWRGIGGFRLRYRDGVWAHGHRATDQGFLCAAADHRRPVADRFRYSHVLRNAQETGARSGKKFGQRRFHFDRSHRFTFALTITNPATLLGFTALFAGLGSLIGEKPRFVEAAVLVGGVAAGSIAWWFTITTIVGLFHKNIDDRAMKWINHAMGVAITLFGLAVIGNLIRAQLA